MSHLRFLIERMSDGEGSSLIRDLLIDFTVIWPDFAAFFLGENLTYGFSLSFLHVFYTVLYALCFSAFLLILSSLLLKRGRL